jgi:hypothetical protein
MEGINVFHLFMGILHSGLDAGNPLFSGIRLKNMQ